jgi:hypothetical protein
LIINGGCKTIPSFYKAATFGVTTIIRTHKLPMVASEASEVNCPLYVRLFVAVSTSIMFAYVAMIVGKHFKFKPNTGRF